MKIRSFLALDLPEEMKGLVSRTSEEMRKYPLDVRWVPTNGIHLTVIFMGDVPLASLSQIGEGAGSVCCAYGPFQLALAGAGVFPNRKRPRVLWLGLAGELERLSAFREALTKRLIPFGINPEGRDFRPHLTLGRFRGSGSHGGVLDEVLARFKDLKGLPSIHRELHLYKSDLRPQGAVYTKLGSWLLSGQD